MVVILPLNQTQRVVRDWHFLMPNSCNVKLSSYVLSFFSIIKKAAIGIAGGISLTGYGYLEKVEYSLHPLIPNIMIFYFFIPIIIKLIVLLLVMSYRSKFDVIIKS